jgi:hypothetical protein
MLQAEIDALYVQLEAEEHEKAKQKQGAPAAQN